MIYKAFRHKENNSWGSISVYTYDNGDTLFELYSSQIPSLFESVDQVSHWLNQEEFSIVEVELFLK